MAKKTNPEDKSNVAPAKGGASNTEKPVEKKERKRVIAGTVETPSIIVPLMIWGALFIVCYALAAIDHRLFGREFDGVLMWIAGLATVVFAVVVPIHRNRRLLTKPFAKGLVFGLGALTLLVGAYAVWAGANFGQPLARGEVRPGEKIEFSVPGSYYRLFVRGFFPPPEPEATPEAALPGKPTPTPSRKPASFKLTGNYSVRISAAQTNEVVKDYTGTFEDRQTYRRVSKRGRDYVHVLKSTELNDLLLPRPGAYQISVLTLDQKLEQKIEYAVYQKRQFATPVFLLGLIAAFLLGLIDHLARPLRVGTFFAVYSGLAYGFGGYLLMTANPINPFSTLAVAILVGFVMGGSMAYAIFTLAGKAYDSIARKYRLSLG